MTDTRHGPHPGTAAAHRRRHERSHAEAELYDNPAARQHPGEPVPVPEQAVTADDDAVPQAAEDAALAELARRYRHLYQRVFAIEDARPDIRAMLHAAAPAIRDQAAAAERDRISQLAELYDAVYTEDGGAEWHRFADLLGGGS